MTKKIRSALISVFYKDGLETIVKQLHGLGVQLYSTGGTQKFIEQFHIPVIPVETLTGFPSILGGRVKTLHPSIFGGILGRRELESDLQEMKQYNIPEIDLVIVDLYPFQQTVDSFGPEPNADGHAQIIEKIDIGGVSLIRAAAKNHKDVVIVASPAQYADIEAIITEKRGETDLSDRQRFAARAFEVCAYYDLAISNYFNKESRIEFLDPHRTQVLRYGENPHQKGTFYGDLSKAFTQLHGKEISYNNLVDIDAAIQLIREFNELTFAIIKHTNVCGIASASSTEQAWQKALAGDPESAFGGVLVCNGVINKKTAEAINEIFFEVLIAHGFQADALHVLKAKKNRILLQCHFETVQSTIMHKSVVNGILAQDIDNRNYDQWDEKGGRQTSSSERADLEFANLVCKHLKSNAIAIVKDRQLIGKGCGQTSRIDALRQAIEKVKQFGFTTDGAVMASDAFFPFDDCVKMGHAAGIGAYIQPGGSIRDKDSIDYCVANQLAMVLTGVRHFKH
jgi:phosphoribosylaminoimidazolecarboxamide formyltransferase/IMP cyclohydrolase